MSQKEGFVKTKKILQKLSIRTMMCVSTQYPEILKSAFNCTCSKYEILKNIVSVYVNLRLRYIGKCINQDVKKNRKRQLLNNLIQFAKQ